MCLCLGTYKFNGKGSPLENPIQAQGGGRGRYRSNPFAASILGVVGVASRTQANTWNFVNFVGWYSDMPCQVYSNASRAMTSIRRVCVSWIDEIKFNSNKKGDYFYSKTNSMHQCIKFILFCNDTLHVTDGLSVHYQEFKTIQYIQQQAFVKQILLYGC